MKAIYVVYQDGGEPLAAFSSLHDAVAIAERVHGASAALRMEALPFIGYIPVDTLDEAKSKLDARQYVARRNEVADDA